MCMCVRERRVHTHARARATIVTFIFVHEAGHTRSDFSAAIVVGTSMRVDFARRRRKKWRYVCSPADEIITVSAR